MDDIPPPPYAETDIYSRSGRSPNSQPGQNDDVASTTGSSSESAIIYTPPETPRESHLDFTGSDDHHTTASAHSYFESRPPVNRAAGQDLVASLPVTEASSPDNFPYPSWARERETTEQDWHTFINYLLPDHASRVNSRLVERKLQAQDDAQSPQTERSAAEAQLGQIKPSADASSQTPHNLDAVIREWNDGFFGPRGVTICRQTPFPNSSSTPASHAPPTVNEPAPAAELSPRPREQETRSRWNPFRSFEVNNRGVRFGGLTVDGDRVSFGTSFEVDRNGVRFNGQNIGPGPGPVPGVSHSSSFPFDNGSHQGWWRDGHEEGRVGGGPWRGPGHDEHERGGRGRGGRWWRTGHNHQGPRSRSRSVSSSSSSDSSRSGQSDSSIGSLPAYDDLRDAQLPVAKQSVAAWLAHPDQPVTKDMVRDARADIKAAKNRIPTPSASKDDERAWEASKQALRLEVKALLARFDELKREQKRARREARKERRGNRRARRRERRERRTSSRAEHRAQRAHERDLHRLGRDCGRGGRWGGGGPAPPDPPAAGAFGTSGSGPARGGRPWEPYVQAQTAQAQALAERIRARVQSQVDVARAHAQSQADVVRSHAQSQADVARAHAQSQANLARSHAQSQADRARSHAQSQADRARSHAQTQAAAAVAAWTGRTPAAASASYNPWSGPWNWQPPPPQPQTQPTASSSTPSTANNTSKYARADELEAALARKAEALRAARAEAEREGVDGDGDAKGKGRSPAQREAEALEDEMDDLSREVRRLRLEADEELARNLAEEDKRGW
ncbi:hypothetical protein GGR52DRAFT_112120 [Hypoxylon sp. FL1284]|nr:hypothetical protein GGR52DRAFT_112120 [Hypoxylon sp. FL1284]